MRVQPQLGLSMAIWIHQVPDFILYTGPSPAR